jgi:hypothetical protein
MKCCFTTLFLLYILTVNAQYNEHRHILLFAPDSTNPMIQKQYTQLMHDKAGLNERDLILTKYYYSNAKHVFKKYGISTIGFTFLLIGKDGFPKYRTKEPISSEKLYSLIDAMPMRRDEIKQAQKHTP